MAANADTGKSPASEYRAADIQVLDDITHVRKRPAMYIGDVGPRGFHHLAYEALDNSVDEAMAGYCRHITFTIHTDGSVSVADDGRGIPVDMHPEKKRPALEVVLTSLRSGGKFEQKAYSASGGLHGVGISVTNALSESFDVEVRRDGGVYQMRLARGLPVGDMRRVGDTAERGTTVRFKPDPEIFGEQEFVADTFAQRLRVVAFLNPGLTMRLRDERGTRDDTWMYEGGIAAFVKHLNENKAAVHENIVEFHKTAEVEGKPITVDIAFQYNQEYAEAISTYVNNIPTPEGGTHLSGFRSALTRTINAYAREAGLKLPGESLSGEDLREGLSAVIAIRIPEPQFEGQTKTKLGNSEVGRMVEQVVNEGLKIALEESPALAKAIINKACVAAEAREAARKMRDMVRRKGALSSGSLPGKLADCQSKDKDESEMFIVEGDSAGGCFAGDTRVALADGRDVTFAELARDWAAGRVHEGYTVDVDEAVQVAPLTHVRRTRVLAPVVRVTLDDDAAIVCTPDHRFMLADGTYRQARHLRPHDALRRALRQPALAAVTDERWDAADTSDPLTAAGPSPESRHVRSVAAIAEATDVYDLEVPDTHNFALAAGVFVHNSAKQARNRRFQAILPIRGKILNVEKARLDKMLSHTEIQTIISALGTGIGHDEFDLSKLRYGRLVIMCDADVDGSHIRTLLLTFLFRQMPQLIEGGHVYIAQPPLYRISRKGHERYVQTEAELTAELLRLGSEGAVLGGPGGLQLDGDGLRAALALLAKAEPASARLQRQEVRLADLLAHGDPATGALPRYRARVGGKAQFVKDDAALEALVKGESTRRGHEVAVIHEDAATAETPPDAIRFHELHGADALGQALAALQAAGLPAKHYAVAGDAKPLFTLKTGESAGTPLRDLASVLDAVRVVGQKGVDVQRFKGLGEMQPEQLWETTMDPDKRTMLKVHINDALEADRIFTMLMGEVVEPRRNFIEKYAREVRFLDV